MIKRSKKVNDYITVITEAQEYFQELVDKRQETYDSRSEKWQESEKGEEEQENLENLEALNEGLTEVVDTLETIFEEI